MRKGRRKMLKITPILIVSKFLYLCDLIKTLTHDEKSFCGMLRCRPDEPRSLRSKR